MLKQQTISHQAPTLNIGKLNHTLQSKQIIAWIHQLKMPFQCHVTVVNEAIQHAKLHSKTLHATWMNLKDVMSCPIYPNYYIHP